MKEKILYIESQSLETHNEFFLLKKLIQVSKEAGYTTIRDVWGFHYKFGEAYDEYTVDEWIEKYCKEELINYTETNSDELSF